MAGWAAGADRQSRRQRRAAPAGPQCNGGLRRSRSCGTPRRDYRAATPTPPDRCRRLNAIRLRGCPLAGSSSGRRAIRSPPIKTEMAEAARRAPRRERDRADSARRTPEKRAGPRSMSRARLSIVCETTTRAARRRALVSAARRAAHPSLLPGGQTRPKPVDRERTQLSQEVL
jgi:hypothetical protein